MIDEDVHIVINGVKLTEVIKLNRYSIIGNYPLLDMKVKGGTDDDYSLNLISREHSIVLCEVLLQDLSLKVFNCKIFDKKNRGEYIITSDIK